MQARNPYAKNNHGLTPEMTPNQRQRARQIAMIVGLVPFLFFAFFGVFACFMFRDWMPLFFFGGFGLAIGVGLGLVTYRGARKKASNLDRPWEDMIVEPYREFAERVNGRLVAQNSMLGGLVPGMPEYVDFAVDGHKAVLRHETERPGNQTSHLRLAIDLAEPTSLRCHVYDQDLVSKITGKDIELGWDRFDQQFAVTAENRADLVPQCLTRRVQETLLKMKDWLRERGHREKVELFIDRNQMAVRVNVLFDNTDDLTKFYEFGKEIHAELLEALS